jgi:uncharacterized pyridoxamine 5'-phosphate oxidase family protein
MNDDAKCYKFMIKKHSIAVMKVKAVYHQYIRVYANLLFAPEIALKKVNLFCERYVNMGEDIIDR